jgi:signal transduction histidine kinase
MRTIPRPRPYLTVPTDNGDARAVELIITWVTEENETFPRFGRILLWIRSKLVLTGEDPPAPISYTLPLVSYVTTVCIVAVVVAVLLWRPITDPLTLAIGSLAVIGMAAFSVRTISGVNAVWSASVSIHLGMTLALGPSAAIIAAVVHAFLGNALVRSGWFRNFFNAAALTLTNLPAWWTYLRLGYPLQPATAPVVGFTIGIAAWAVNHLLVSGVVRISSQGRTSFVGSLRQGLTVLPHTLAYGWAAVGMALLYNQAGLTGFTMFLIPILSGQVFLVLLARRTNAHQQELRDAEERERRRIARDLHDSVVQVVAGTAMSLSANSMTSHRPQPKP